MEKKSCLVFLLKTNDDDARARASFVWKIVRRQRNGKSLSERGSLAAIQASNLEKRKHQTNKTSIIWEKEDESFSIIFPVDKLNMSLTTHIYLNLYRSIGKYSQKSQEKAENWLNQRITSCLIEIPTHQRWCFFRHSR